MKISSLLKDDSRVIYPPVRDIFRAFYMTRPEQMTVVLMGQDPYHSGVGEYDGSAMGLAFSVRPGNSLNPSIRNIYKELDREGFTGARTGDLRGWTGHTLLINMALTVARGSAGSHTEIWRRFSEELISYIDRTRGGEVTWLLFGKDAHAIAKYIQHGRIVRTSHQAHSAVSAAPQKSQRSWDQMYSRLLKESSGGE